MKSKYWVLAVVLSFVVFTSAYAYEGGGGWQSQKGGSQAQCAKGGHFAGHHQRTRFGWQRHKKSEITGTFFRKAGFMMREKEAIGLSEDQVKTIRSIKLEAVKSLIRNKADIKVIDLDMRSQLREDSPDAASIEKLIDSKYETKKTFDKSMLNSLIKLEAVPDEKQQATLKTLKKERMEKIFGHSKNMKENPESDTNVTT